MATVYDLHLRSTSLSRPRRAPDERRRVSGSHSVAPPEPPATLGSDRTSIGGEPTRPGRTFLR
jgi:hypothetical protein